MSRRNGKTQELTDASDRSWRDRAGVERVTGFCAEDEATRDPL